MVLFWKFFFLNCLKEGHFCGIFFLNSQYQKVNFEFLIIIQKLQYFISFVHVLGSFFYIFINVRVLCCFLINIFLNVISLSEYCGIGYSTSCTTGECCCGWSFMLYAGNGICWCMLYSCTLYLSLPFVRNGNTSNNVHWFAASCSRQLTKPLLPQPFCRYFEQF